MRITDPDGNLWVGPTTDDSPVGKTLNGKPPSEPGPCLICAASGKTAPATASSMVDTLKSGQEAIFVIKTCAEHTGRWSYKSPILINDGETQRWN